MPLPLNLDYIKTKPGLFKTLSVVVALFAVIFTAIAYDSGKYYNFKCTPNQALQFDKDLALLKQEIGNLNDALNNPSSILKHLPIPNSCEESRLGTRQHCEYQKKVGDFFKKLLKTPLILKFPIFKSVREIVNEFPEDCTPIWIPTVAVYLIGITWGISFILLVILFVIHVHENVFEHRLDIFGHCCVTGLFLLSTDLLIVFLIFATSGRFPCTQKLFEKTEALGVNQIGTGALGNNGLGVIDASLLNAIAAVFVGGNQQGSLASDVFNPNGPGFGRTLWTLQNAQWAKSRSSSGREEEKAPSFKDCPEYRSYTYKTELLIVGIVFAAIATILYGTTVVVLWKAGVHKEEGPRPGTLSVVNSGDLSTAPNIKLSLDSQFTLTSTRPSDLPISIKKGSSKPQDIVEMHG